MPPSPFATFVQRFDALVDAGTRGPDLRGRGAGLLRALVARDDWLADGDAAPDPAHYRQNLLHLDPAGRYSVVAFVWGPGQCTPLHDHTVWGLIGMLRGAETSQGYRFAGPGRLVEDGPPARLAPGDVETVGPDVGDIHRVRNAHADRTSISIHVYGGDIGRIARATYHEDGTRLPFVSGYSTPWTAAPAPSDKASP